MAKSVADIVKTVKKKLSSSNASSSSTRPSTSKKARNEDCYFKCERKTDLETKPRPQISTVSINCKSEALISLYELSKKVVDCKGADSQSDAIMARGEGDFFWERKTHDEMRRIFICQDHIKELCVNWDNFLEYPHIHRRRDNKKYCEVSSVEFPELNCNGTTPYANPKTLSKNLAKKLLLNRNVLFHFGISICRGHYDAIRALDDLDLEAALERMEIEQNAAEEERMDAENTMWERVTPLLEKLGRELGLQHFGSYANSPKFSNLDRTTKAKKAKDFLQIFDVLCSYAAPNDELAFKNYLNLGTSIPSNNSNDFVFKLMEKVNEAYSEATTFRGRSIALSLVSSHFDFPTILRYIPGVTQSAYYRAKQFNIFNDAVKTEPFIREKSRDKVKCFVDFISSPEIMTDLPRGYYSFQLSNGQTIEVGAMLKRHSNANIVRLYEKHLSDTSNLNMKMASSTYYAILNSIPSKKTSSAVCVDYFFAKGEEGFVFLQNILAKLANNVNLDQALIKNLSKSLKKSRIFLVGEYRHSLKLVSTTMDFCSRYALSDPDDIDFQDRSFANPEYRSEKAIALEEQIGHVENLLKSNINDANLFNAQEKEEYLNQMSLAPKYIIDLKCHYLRAFFSEQVKNAYLSTLKENEAFLTLDYAQKFLPKRHLEKQSDYYAKRGINYHIIHVQLQKGNSIWTHWMVHIFDNLTQNSDSVLAILQHTLKFLNDKIGIKRVCLRSDEAGYYRSARIIKALPLMKDETGVEIYGYTFSEPQTGKGPADRGAAYVKKRIQNYINFAPTHQVTNASEMLKAFKGDSYDPAKKASMFVCKMIQKTTNKESFPNITKFNDFRFDSNGDIIAWKHANVGSGKLFKNIKTKQGLPKLEVLEFYSQDSNYLVEDQQEEVFENNPNSEDENEDEDDDEAIDDDSEFEKCPICRKTYWNHASFVKHCGKCTIQSKLPLSDFVLSTFQSAVNTITSEEPEVVTSGDIEANESNSLPEGWALAGPRKRARFSMKQRKFLKTLYDLGVKTPANKVSPENAAALMKTERKNGNLLFGYNEYLTPAQIRGVYNQFKKGVSSDLLENEDEDNDGMNDEEKDDDSKEIVAEDTADEIMKNLDEQGFFNENGS